MRKRFFQVKQKLKILHDIHDATTREENRLTLAKACEQNKINFTMYYRWRAQEDELRTSDNKKAYSLNKGLPPQITEQVDNEVYEWLMSLRKEGTVVTYAQIEERMSLLDTNFANKSTQARSSVVQRFCKRHKYRCVRKKRTTTTTTPK